MTNVIIKPVITEKSQLLSGDGNRFTFVVAKTANKYQIREAVERQFEVSVTRVNTIRMPAKLKSRFTKRGLQRGRRNAYKKAIITLKDGDTIDFYGEL